MGRIFLIDFHQADGDVYVCAFCDVPIALVSKQEYYVQEADLIKGHIFSGVKNVIIVPAQNRNVNNNTVTEIYCTKCGADLGFKIIRVAADEITLDDGDYVIPLNKLKIVAVPQG